MNELIDLLNQGIDHKRAGQYDAALECYSKAIAMDPDDRRGYVNSARLLLGVKRYDLSLRYFLVGCVYDRLYGNYDQNPAYEMVIEQVIDRIRDKELKLKSYQILANSIISKCQTNPFLKDLLFDLNYIFYIGHAVVALNDVVIENHNISRTLMRNLEYNLLGKPKAPDLRDSDKDYVFLLCALFFADKNCIDSFTSVESAAGHYLSKDTGLDYELSPSANA